MKTDKIVQARLTFHYNGHRPALIRILEDLFRSEITFQRKDAVEEVEYYGGESLGIRFFLEIKLQSNEYGFYAISSNPAIKTPSEPVDITFHFENLLANIDEIYLSKPDRHSP